MNVSSLPSYNKLYWRCPTKNNLKLVNRIEDLTFRFDDASDVLQVIYSRYHYVNNVSKINQTVGLDECEINTMPK